LPITTVDLKSDRPKVIEALARLEQALDHAHRQGVSILKIIHGYGSTGTGGDIRIAVQKRLYQMAEAGEIEAVIFGENWSKADETTWRLIKAKPELKNDPHLGRTNRGVTIVVLRAL
jgi:hypothetical protein